MDIKPSHTCIGMNNYDTCNEPLATNKSNIKKFEEVYNNEVKFAREITDIYKEANNNILIQKRETDAHSTIKEAINSLSKSEVSSVTKSDYDKDDLIKLFSKKSESNNDETRIFSNAHKLFDISAHREVNDPDRPYLTTTKKIGLASDLAATVLGGAVGYFTDPLLDPQMNSTDRKVISTVAGGIVATLVKQALGTYVAKRDHDAKLGDERNSALFKCTQSLAKDRLKGMELFEEKHIAASEFKLIPPETKPQEVSIQMP